VAGKAATAVGTGIAVATKHMKELDAPTKVVILMTDGRSNAGSLTPLQAAEAAKALGVKVYTIGVGSTGGGSVIAQMLGRGGADVDEPTLQAVAETTGGRYYRATDATALAKVYEEIDTLEKSTAQVKEYVHRDELYLGFVLPALALYLLEKLLGFGPLRRLP
jgi:Ca-activated chloride channel homolog